MGSDCMNAPTLSIVIPTAGRPTLRRTLDSIAPQILPGDEVIVCGDTHDGPLRVTEEIVADYPFVRYIELDAGGHDWGHAQINAALDLASGDYVLGQDDDDVFTPDAFACIRDRALAYPGQPLMTQFQSYWGFVYWHTPGLIAQGHVGGHCLVVPNQPGMVGRFTARYEGDFDWIVDTLERWQAQGIAPVWVDHICTVQRPGEGE